MDTAKEEKIIVVDDTPNKEKELKLYFSLISGELYYIEADEVKNQDEMQLPLKKKPNLKCGRCYGRFYIGYEVNKKYYVPCPTCSRKCIDFETVNDVVTISAPKSTNEIDDQFSQAVNEATGLMG